MITIDIGRRKYPRGNRLWPWGADSESADPLRCRGGEPNVNAWPIAGRTLALIFLLLFAAPLDAGDSPRVHLVDLHSHLRSGPHVRDDGSEELDARLDRFRKAGFDAVFHTPHSDLNDDPALWARQRKYLRGRDLALPLFLGEEVTVEKGPNWGVLLRRRNNDHLGVVGQTEWITHALPMKAVCEWAHGQGAVVIVNHPGPGPSLWEAGYWDRPGLRDRIDAIEILNGRLLHAHPLDFFRTYLRAVSYREWGLKVAAVAGTDTHSAREKPEVGTLVVAKDVSEASIVDAIRNRRTFVVYRLLDLRLTCRNLGRVIASGKVSLDLVCSRKVEKIRLYREGTEVGCWLGKARVRFREAITRNAAYAWRIDDGKGRAFSSAIWFEPVPDSRPDLLIVEKASTLVGGKLGLSVRNDGGAPARAVVVEVWSDFPFRKGRLLERRTVPEIGAGAITRITFRLKPAPDRVFIRVDPDAYALDRDDDKIEESDERNNCAIIRAD